MYPDADPDGIYILSDNPEYADAEIGSDAIGLLGLHDVVFEYEITSNRVDCFGVLGIAREAAATFGRQSMSLVSYNNSKHINVISIIFA